MSNHKEKTISKEDKGKLKIIIESLEKDPRAYDFLTPVDYVGNFFIKDSGYLIILQ